MRDGGVVWVCDLVNEAGNGDMPQLVLHKKNKYWFEERYVGYSRQYAAMGVNQQVDRLLRLKQDRSIQIGQYAVLGNGEQYRIDNVAHGQDQFERTKMIDQKYYRRPMIVDLKYTDITLSRMEQNYDVAVDED